LDIAVLVLVGVMIISLYPVLKRVNKIWAIVAMCLPILGLGIYILTHDIGRSGVLGAGLISAAVMLRSATFRKDADYVGLLANILLLVGDIGTAFTYSRTLAIIMGIGYVLFMVWCVLISWRLFQLGRHEGE